MFSVNPFSNNTQRFLVGFSLAFVAAIAFAPTSASAIQNQQASSLLSDPTPAQQDPKQKDKRAERQKRTASESASTQGTKTPKSDAVKPKNDGVKKPPTPVGRKRINEILAFVKTHHKEIVPLLRTLQQKHKIQFQAKMRLLDREVKVLQAQEEKSPERYQRSLQLWITRSKTKLIAVQVAMAKNEKEANKLKKQMKSLINKHYDIRQKQIQADLATYQARVDRSKKQLKDLAAQREKAIDRQIESMTRSAENMKRAQGTQKKNAKDTDKE